MATLRSVRYLLEKQRIIERARIFGKLKPVDKKKLIKAAATPYKTIEHNKAAHDQLESMVYEMEYDFITLFNQLKAHEKRLFDEAQIATSSTKELIDNYSHATKEDNTIMQRLRDIVVLLEQISSFRKSLEQSNALPKQFKTRPPYHFAIKSSLLVAQKCIEKYHSLQTIQKSIANDMDQIESTTTETSNSDSNLKSSGSDSDSARPVDLQETINQLKQLARRHGCKAITSFAGRPLSTSQAKRILCLKEKIAQAGTRLDLTSQHLKEQAPFLSAVPYRMHHGTDDVSSWNFPRRMRGLRKKKSPLRKECLNTEIVDKMAAKGARAKARWKEIKQRKRQETNAGAARLRAAADVEMKENHDHDCEARRRSLRFGFGN
jgi:hypothetical protein